MRTCAYKTCLIKYAHYILAWFGLEEISSCVCVWIMLLYRRRTTAGFLLVLACQMFALAYGKRALQGTWTKFWWLDAATTWPTAVKDVLGKSYGSCNLTDPFCFQRLPGWTVENSTELLAIDSQGTIYQWTFEPSNPTAHAVWLAFHDHQETAAKKVSNNRPWNPQVIEGAPPKAAQDSFMYRVQNGVKSVLLDDDNCDCLSTLSFGHGMCNAGHDTKYSKAGDFGADYLYDPKCYGPRPSVGLSLYFRSRKELHLSEYGGGWTAFWWWTPGATWPTQENDVLGYPYGSCTQHDYYCFQRLPTWAQENFTELLGVDSRGTVYRWQFDSSNPTAHAVWQAFHDHVTTPYKKVLNSKMWNPVALVGNAPQRNQDSFMYRDVKGLKSLVLDDDNGDYYTSLNIGYGMDGPRPFSGLGVDYLYDLTGAPDVKKGLTLYFRVQHTRLVHNYGSGWKPFWWFPPGVAWPSCKSPNVTDVLQDPYGTCQSSDVRCFQRLPAWAYEDKTEILAVDAADTVYKWKFSSSNPTSHAAWGAFHGHSETASGAVKDRSPWNPVVLRGKSPVVAQDSFMYRTQGKTKSLLLDDDNCDCLSSLNIGTSMCGGGVGKGDTYGVDNLYDPTCGVPKATNGLWLYFRTEKDTSFMAYGQRWTAFWWWTKDATWPKNEKDVLGYDYGHCKEHDVYCFQRLPSWAIEDHTHLLAIDTEGNTYTWTFSSSNPTAHAVWLAFHSHQETPNAKIKNNKPWNPKVIKGTKPKGNQDSFMYRAEHGVKSVILDDDNCDCLSTLSMGHGLCGSGFSTSYGPENRFGVDALYDHYCNTPRPSVGLALYFSTSRPMTNCGHGGNWIAFWWWSANAKWPATSVEDDVIGHEYGHCAPRDLYCFGRLPTWAKEDSAEMLGVDSGGNEFKWQFDSSNPTAHAAWRALHDHQTTAAGKIVNNKPWDPVVLKGKSPKYPQDSFMYREQNGVKSILLDDDNCDCETTLNIGHGMCGNTHNPKYGPANQYGVDTLYDPGCQVPRPSVGLTLYFRTS